MIRRAVFNDTPALVKLAKDYCHAKGMQPDGEMIAATMDAQIRDCIFFVYEKDDEVLGGIALSIGQDALTGLPTVKKNAWYVAEQANGHGIELLREAEKYAEEVGAKEMWVGVEDERAFALMEKRGYAHFETQYRKAI